MKIDGTRRVKMGTDKKNTLMSFKTKGLNISLASYTPMTETNEKKGLYYYNTYF